MPEDEDKMEQNLMKNEGSKEEILHGINVEPQPYHSQEEVSSQPLKE